MKNYENDSNKIIRKLLIDKNMSFKQFTDLFNEHNEKYSGKKEKISVQALNTKLSRNSFSASFFIQCLHVLNTDIESILNNPIIKQIEGLKLIKVKNSKNNNEIFLLGDFFNKYENLENICFLELEKDFQDYKIGDILIYEKTNEILKNNKYLFNFFDEVIEQTVEEIKTDSFVIQGKDYKNEMVSGLILGKLLYGIRKH